MQAALGLSTREKQRFSIARAIHAAAVSNECPTRNELQWFFVITFSLVISNPMDYNTT